MYFLPREGYFKVAFVFGQKAYDVVMASELHDRIKRELEQATKYVEDWGIAVAIENQELIPDIERLIRFNLEN